MFEFCQQVLLKVSFDPDLFRKELVKMIGLLQGNEVVLLKSWCLFTFVQHRDIILEVFRGF